MILDASDNSMFGEDDKSGVTAWAEAIKINTSITELNIAKNYIDAGDAKILSPAIGANGALVKFTISDNDLRAEGGKALAEALKDNTIMKELNIAKNNLSYNAHANTDTSGVIAISDAIPTMGALTSLNLANNQISVEGAKHIAAALPQCK